MKQVIEQYASGVIATVIALVIFLIIGQGIYKQNMGIEQVLGLVLKDSIGEKSIVENGVFEDYVKETTMDIERKTEYLIANKETLAENCFCIKNGNGEIQSSYWKRAWNLDGKDVDVKISQDRSKICFSKIGVYWVEIFAVDRYENEHSWIVKVLVNER